MALEKIFTKSFNAMRELGGKKSARSTKSLEEKSLQKTDI